MGSFPVSQQTNVPVDTKYIGFAFSSPIATSTIISATATTTVTLTAQGSNTNLCTSVSYNPFPGNFEPPAKCNLLVNLSPSTVYTFTATTSIRDLSGVQLDQDSFQAGNQGYSATFTTGVAGFTNTNVTPPSVVGTNPFPGSLNVPTNIKTFSVEFNQSAMDTTTLTSANITLSGVDLSAQTFAFSTTTGKNILSVTLTSALTANTSYTLAVNGGVKNTSGIFIMPYTAKFTTGTGADTSAPVLTGILPAPATTIPANTSDFVFFFDDALNGTTATSGSVTLKVGSSALPSKTSRVLPWGRM